MEAQQPHNNFEFWTTSWILMGVAKKKKRHATNHVAPHGKDTGDLGGPTLSSPRRATDVIFWFFFTA